MNRNRRLGAAVAALLLVVACGAPTPSAPVTAASVVPSASGSTIAIVPPATGTPGAEASPTTEPSPGPAAWASVTRTRQVVGGKLFGGDGNQYMFAATGYRDGFVAVGEDCCGAVDTVTGAVWTSPDGTSWSRIESKDVFGSAEVDHVAASGRRIVAFGQSRADPQARPQTLVWVSDDGLAWRRSDAAALVFNGSFRPTGVVGGALGFIAWGESPSRAVHVEVSADGESWTDAGFADADSQARLGGIASWRGGWVAVGGKATGQDPATGAVKVGRAEAWYSADGAHWSPGSADGFGLGQVYAGADGLLALGGDGSGCTACLPGPGVVWHSDDGRSWRPVGPDPFPEANYATDGVHIARISIDVNAPASRDETLAVSLDGAHWTTLATGLAGEQHLGLAVGSRGILLLEPAYKDGAKDQVDAGVWYLSAG